MIVAEGLKVDSYGHGSFNYQIPAGSGTYEHCRIFVQTWEGYNVVMSDYSDGEFTIEYRMKPPDQPLIPDRPKVTVVEEVSQQPVCADFLGAAAPNPLNPWTSIDFGLKDATSVYMAIFDVSGRRVKLFYENSLLPAGRHSVYWDGKNDAGLIMPSGVFFLKFQGGTISKSQKLIIIR